MKGTFRSMQGHNYRLWAAGAFVSNVGTWMQRIAQDWLVLTVLTKNSGTAVGIVMALQFGPQLALMPLTGYAADRLDRRKLLIGTQVAQALLALGLGLLTVSGRVQLWEVYLFACLLGCTTAFDAPARQTFVAELVGDADLANAVALNSTSFSAARMIGPAIAGLLIASIGTGWAFLLNAASFVAVLFSLALLRLHELHPTPKAPRAKGGLGEGLRYAWGRADLRTAFIMLFLIGTFGFNFPIFISTMSVTTFKGGADQYGLLTAMLAVGSVIGALLAAGREQTSLRLLTGAAAFFGLGCALAALMPSHIAFGLVLVAIGIAIQTFMTSTNALVQLSTEPAMRGRIIAILLALTLGTTPLGAPLVGWIADQAGPRWALGVGAASGFLAALVGLRYLLEQRKLKAASGPL